MLVSSPKEINLAIALTGAPTSPSVVPGVDSAIKFVIQSALEKYKRYQHKHGRSGHMTTDFFQWRKHARVLKDIGERTYDDTGIKIECPDGIETGESVHIWWEQKHQTVRRLNRELIMWSKRQNWELKYEMPRHETDTYGQRYQYRP